MKEQIEKILADVFTRHADRRLDLFKVQVESAAASEVKLAGRVLTPDSLDAVRHGIAAACPGAAVNTDAVKVLRAKPGVMHTVVTTLTDLHVEPSFLSEMLTQVVNGTPLEVLDEHPDGKWAFVRQTDGYLGWAHKPYLAQGAPRAGATHIVTEIAPLFRDPGSNPPTSRLLPGTTVRVLDERDSFAHIEAAGVLAGGWVPSNALRPLTLFPLPPSDARPEIVRAARQLTGVYYLWGGSTPWGTDCSGLAQLTHKLVGYTLPRDADMQFRAGVPVEPPFRPGDLLFFHSESNKDKITHVGISAGRWNMIHSSRSRNGVYEEDVQANDTLRTTFAGARSFLPR